MYNIKSLADIADAIAEVEERIAIMFHDGGEYSNDKCEQLVAESRGYISYEAFLFDMSCKKDEIEYEQSIETNRKGDAYEHRT